MEIHCFGVDSTSGSLFLSKPSQAISICFVIVIFDGTGALLNPEKEIITRGSDLCCGGIE